MEIQNGEDIIGYQYLHGTNSTVGDFHIIGTVNKDESGNTEYDMTYGISSLKENKMLIYKRNIHSLLNTDSFSDYETFSWAICNTLEMVVDCSTGRLLGVKGFFPLNKAKEERIRFPRASKENYYFDNYMLENTTEYAIYQFDSRFPEYEGIFSIFNLFFDEKSGIIKCGIDSTDGIAYAVSPNLVVISGRENELQCIYIKPDLFE